MPANRDFNGIIILLFVVAAISKCCNGNKESCYQIDSKGICYFQPSGTNRNRNWENAARVCKENNSTLPDIENTRIQETLEGYLKGQKPSLPEIWVAGREFLTKEWRWLDGEPISNQTRVNGNKTFAVLTKRFNYSPADQSEKHNYICKYHGNARCRSKNVSRAGSGCIVAYNGTTLSFIDARIKCLEGGGDLATFEGDEDLTNFKSRSVRLLVKNTYWIGLSRVLWIWNITALDRKGKSNLTNNCRYMKSDENKWRQGPYNETRATLCQRDNVITITVNLMATSKTTGKSTQDLENFTPTSSRKGNDDTSANESAILHDFPMELLAAIIVGAIVASVIIVTLIFRFRKLCGKEATDEEDRLSNGNQTHRNECKGADETTEMCGLYAEVTRTLHDEDHGNNINDPQTSIEYATLEFASNRVAKEESVTSNPHKINATSVPVGSAGISQVQALDVNIYSEII